MSKKEIKEEVVMDEAAALEAKKQAKRDAAKRCNDKKKAAKEEFIKNITAFNEDMKAKGFWDQLSDEQKAFLEHCANPVRQKAEGTGKSTSSVFNLVFGDEPKVGDSITLMEIFNKTLKGKSNIDACVKQWANKGIIVKETPNAENVFETTYTIEALPTA